MKTCLPLILLGVCFGCHSAKDDTTHHDSFPVASDSMSTEKVEQPQTPTLTLKSGQYGDGLRLAVAGDSVTGYYEEASGWNEALQMPQFSCAYTFVGHYEGGDQLAISLRHYPNAKGNLEILSPEKFSVSLSLNPCRNEEATREVWTLRKAYPLLSLQTVRVERAYFHARPEKETQQKAYLIKGDRVEVTAKEGDWYQVSYTGARSTTTGWMHASSFRELKSEVELTGTWLSKAGQPYAVFYRFYPDHRYKTWDLNSFEPQGMTGDFSVKSFEAIQLTPCDGSPQTLHYTIPENGQLTMMLPRSDTWTVFEKHAAATTPAPLNFVIEKRRIRTSINNRVRYIPSNGSQADFLRAVCPFTVVAGTIYRGEGEFDVLNVYTTDRTPLFYAIVDGDEITALVVTNHMVAASGISVGSTFAELKKAIPSATLSRSEIEGRIVGSTEDFSFSFGASTLFNTNDGTLPDTVKIKEVVL